MREVEELRPLTAGRLLTLWRKSGETAEEPVERALLCNAQVLAESCLCQGEPVFEDEKAVLEALTTREMERLLRQLAEGRDPGTETGNPAFDPARFQRLREESQ